MYKKTYFILFHMLGIVSLQASDTEKKEQTPSQLSSVYATALVATVVKKPHLRPIQTQEYISLQEFTQQYPQCFTPTTSCQPGTRTRENSIASLEKALLNEKSPKTVECKKFALQHSPTKLNPSNFKF